jgi:hypothetical protein
MAANPPAAHKAIMTPAAPMDRRGVGLLIISFLPVLVVCNRSGSHLAKRVASYK